MLKNLLDQIVLPILEILNNIFSHLLTEIVNLSFKTGIFHDLCKLPKIMPIFKKDDHMLSIIDQSPYFQFSVKYLKN